MIAADAQLLTYVQAANALNISGTDEAKKKFIQRLVASGKLVVTDLGHSTKRISELDLQTYKNKQRAVDKVRPRR